MHILVPVALFHAFVSIQAVFVLRLVKLCHPPVGLFRKPGRGTPKVGGTAGRGTPNVGGTQGWGTPRRDLWIWDPMMGPRDAGPSSGTPELETCVSMNQTSIFESQLTTTNVLL